MKRTSTKVRVAPVIKYVSGIFLDFDNVYGSLFRRIQ